MTTKTVTTKSSIPKAAAGQLPSDVLADLSPEDFAILGEGDVAYLKALSFEDIRRLFPQVRGLRAGQGLFALVGADGAPIVLADTAAAALGNAFEHDLEMVALH